MGQINIQSTDASHKASLTFTGTSDKTIDANTIVQTSDTTASIASGKVVVDSSGNVGIGTASPVKKLEVFQNDGGIRLGHGFSTSDYSELSFSSVAVAGSGAAIRSYRASDTYSGNEGDLRFYTNSGSGGASSDGTEKMRLDASGNLGIGTASPGGRLHVKGAYGATAESLMKLSRYDGAVTADFYYNGVDGSITYGTTTNHPLAFKTNNTERMRIDSYGNFRVNYQSSFVLDDSNSGTWRRSCTNGYLSSTSTWRLGILNSWYWGRGGVTIKLTRQGYTAFDYAEFVLYGHTDRPSGYSVSYYTKVPWASSGPTPIITAVTYQSTDANSAGYVEIRFEISPYWQYKAEIISPIPIYNVPANLVGYDANNMINTFCVFPEQTLV